MSALPIAAARLLALVVLLSAGAALAADPPRKAGQAAKPPAKSENCGELPRGGRAYKDCLSAQSRRDTPAEPAVKPVFSSR
jgi:hypothetical protein